MKELGKYLAEATAKCVEEWAQAVRMGVADASTDVLSSELQSFLGACEIDQGRLHSRRRSGSDSDSKPDAGSDEA